MKYHNMRCKRDREIERKIEKERKRERKKREGEREMDWHDCKVQGYKLESCVLFLKVSQ